MKTQKLKNTILALLFSSIGIFYNSCSSSVENDLPIKQQNLKVASTPKECIMTVKAAGGMQKVFYIKGDHPSRAGLPQDKINYVHVDNYNSKLVYFTAYEHDNFKGRFLTLKVEKNQKTRAFDLRKYELLFTEADGERLDYWSNNVSSFQIRIGD